MSGRHLSAIVRQARQRAAAELPDGELLRRFAAARDEAAFAALVGRHGALVWSVCRTLLRHEQDAEDAFQATFLVLARRSHTVRAEVALSNWLFGVARRVALKARTAAARRLALQRRKEPAPDAEPAATTAALRELQAILHEEVERLPAEYRAAFVLCCLQGLARRDAARELGWKEGTLSARLTHARRLLESRLASRGVALSAALGASALGAPAAVPPALAATSLIHEASSGAVALAERVINTMILTKWKAAGAMLLILLSLAAGVGLATRAVSPPEAKAKTPDGPDLVRAVRQRQDWFHKGKSFSVRFEGTITDAKGKVIAEAVGASFDERRLRHTLARKGFDEELHLWDGKRATTYVRPATGGADRYVYSRDMLDVGDGMSAGLLWLWGQPHTFWWTRPEKDPVRAQLLRDMEGEPEKFAITGRATYRGIPCHVLQLKGGQMVRLYVGERTGHLHGRMEGWLFGNPEADRLAVKAAAAEGKKVKDFVEFIKWSDTLGNEKSNRLVNGVLEKCFPTDHPKNEAWFLDYKEVQHGRWFPMTQGTAGHKGTHAKPVTEYRSEWKAVEVKIDAALPGSLFSAPPPKDGAAVYDTTADPPLNYTHKKDRTPAEWEKLRAEARKLQADALKEQARRDELIGKPALPLPKDGWVQGKARTWRDLKGKPVLLLFWAEWCGPCHGFLPLLRAGENDGMLVVPIGVHTPGGARADIEKVLKEEKAAAAVCIDTVSDKGVKSYGSLFEGYRLGGLPSAVLVDADGKIAALGDPSAVMRKANELARKAAEKKR